MTCPHADIIFCPLYLASHDGSNGFGCDDGQLGEGGCAVTRGLSYSRMVVKLPARNVAVLAWAEQERADRQQRYRNMRRMGIQ